MGNDRKIYGTRDHDAPVARNDFERALRHLHLSDSDLRDLVLRLAAHVVALTEKLGVSVDDEIPETLMRIQTRDTSTARFWLDNGVDSKYDIESASPPCEELMHLCGARCCKMTFALSIQDLDEGVLRWDYGQPYMIRQRASDGFCVHNDPTSHGCTVHAQRPATCRRYDCRKDKRVWLDYEARIPTPANYVAEDSGESPPIDMVEVVRKNELAELFARSALRLAYPDEEAHEGPPVEPRKPGPMR